MGVDDSLGVINSEKSCVFQACNVSNFTYIYIHAYTQNIHKKYKQNTFAIHTHQTHTHTHILANNNTHSYTHAQPYLNTRTERPCKYPRTYKNKYKQQIRHNPPRSTQTTEAHNPDHTHTNTLINSLRKKRKKKVLSNLQQTLNAICANRTNSGRILQLQSL